MNTKRFLQFPALAAVALAALTPSALRAAPYAVGPKTCQECHKAEYDIWEKTKHSASFKDLHKNAKVADILAATGGEKNIRKNTLCTQCHYTLEQADESSPATAKNGVSCESCHGTASNWVKIHNDYGGPDVKRETEPAAHKTDRIAKSIAAGMKRPDTLYDLAVSCLQCHSLARATVDGETVGKMVAAGHPINGDYELVKYSQGTVRHRFYPPDVTVNAEMKPAELARMFVVGRAAMLVTATDALKKSDNATFQEALKKQVKNATDALAAVKSAPEAAALVAAPTEANARKLVAAIADKDLSGEVKPLLPAAADYK